MTWRAQGKGACLGGAQLLADCLQLLLQLGVVGLQLRAVLDGVLVQLICAGNLRMHTPGISSNWRSADGLSPANEVLL